MKWQQIQGEVCHAWKSLILLSFDDVTGILIYALLSFYDVTGLLIYAQVAQEYDVVKNIMQTLNQFKVFQFMSISNDLY